MFAGLVVLVFERISLTPCPFPSLLSCEGAFSDFVDSDSRKIILGARTPDPHASGV